MSWIALTKKKKRFGLGCLKRVKVLEGRGSIKEIYKI